MGYRKVTYIEQIWYILKYWISHRKERKKGAEGDDGGEKKLQ